MRQRGRSIVAGAFAAVVLAGIAGCAPSQNANPGDAELTSIKIAPVSASPILWAPHWLAGELGYYEEEGLDVEVVSNLSGGAVENALLLGDLDFGATNQSRLIPLRAEHGKDEIKIFMPESNYLFRVMVLADSPYKTADDLIGQTIGVTEPGGDEDTVALLMGLENIERDEFTTLAVGGRASAGVALDRGQIAAFMGSFADEDAIVRSGVEVRLIEVGESQSFYNSGLSTTVQTLEERPEIAVAYGRAIAKATVWMYENPEAAIAALGRVTPEAVANREDALALLKASLENNRSLIEAMSRTDKDIWESMIDAQLNAGVISEKVEVDSILTDELLDQIWDFDLDAVRADAREAE